MVLAKKHRNLQEVQEMGRGTYALSGSWVPTSLARYAARGFLLVVIAWLGQANPAFAAKEEQVKLKWSQLG